MVRVQEAPGLHNNVVELSENPQILGVDAGRCDQPSWTGSAQMDGQEATSAALRTNL